MLLHTNSPEIRFARTTMGALYVSLVLIATGLVCKSAFAQDAGNSANKFIKVLFEQVRDLVAFEKRYPFLNVDIENIVKYNQRNRDPAKIFFAELNRTGRRPLYFVHGPDPIACGNHGCSLSVMDKNGHELLDALGFFDLQNVYVPEGDSSLITCDRDGKTEWQFLKKPTARPVTKSVRWNPANPRKTLPCPPNR